jgi:VIT1/CCC1 family predicted Fe2+/Mn2+ transporter
VPLTPHTERHFLASESVRDVVIGMADGLTVPFALAAGLSGAVAATNIIMTAGLAEVAAGAIAMGLGGFLAARTDIEHFRTEHGREMRETVEMPDEERAEVRGIFRQQGLDQAQAEEATTALTQDRERWVRFMMRFELGLEEPDPRRAFRSALTIGGAYIAGGLVPLLPYMLLRSVQAALPVSILLTLVTLFVFGAVKGRLTGVPTLRGGAQTVLIGGLAAGAAFAIARMVGG